MINKSGPSPVLSSRAVPAAAQSNREGTERDAGYIDVTSDLGLRREVEQ